MYKSLQSGRAIAAMLVVLFHLGANLAKDNYFGLKALAVPFSFGDSGVEFFFVLSGFIILTAHFADIGQPGRIGEYLRKRLLRIYPTYWLIFLPVFAVALIVPSMRAGVPHDLATIVQSLLLVPQDKAVAGGTGAPVIIVAWTLQYEMLFYSFFALLVVNVRLAMAAGTAVFGCFVFGIFMGPDQLPFPLSFVAKDYILLFGMGMMVAWLVAANKPLAASTPQQCIGVGVAIFLLVAMDVVSGADFLAGRTTLLYGLAASLIVFGLVTAERAGKTYLGHKWFQLLGDASYALYLIHFPLISLLCKVAMVMHAKDYGLAGAIASFFVIFPLCLVTSVLLHLWVERPIAAYFRRPRT